MLPTMMAYKDALRELSDKKKDIWEDFYTTEAMTNWKCWKPTTNYDML